MDKETFYTPANNLKKTQTQTEPIKRKVEAVAVIEIPLLLNIIGIIFYNNEVEEEWLLIKIIE